MSSSTGTASVAQPFVAISVATHVTPAAPSTAAPEFRVPDQADLSVCKGPSVQASRLKDQPYMIDDETKPEDVYLDYETLVEVWSFADMRGIPALGNAAIDMLHEQIAAK
ncbi:hypothetical protein EK21DRAFT_86628 [Setomelanomma holmii]|uniref:Uncharacterized protein n=1 Tax=Setomelanomma holmii TaxID=210430 RepID=A0A9P4HGJ5_9PLEO|nr:hypothetical protein EK21DRAFT_86628 [Setomelanomma holmii]